MSYCLFYNYLFSELYNCAGNGVQVQLQSYLQGTAFVQYATPECAVELYRLMIARGKGDGYGTYACSELEISTSYEKIHINRRT